MDPGYLKRVAEACATEFRQADGGGGDGGLLLLVVRSHAWLIGNSDYDVY